MVISKIKKTATLNITRARSRPNVFEQDQNRISMTKTKFKTARIFVLILLCSSLDEFHKYILEVFFICAKWKLHIMLQLSSSKNMYLTTHNFKKHYFTSKTN